MKNKLHGSRLHVRTRRGCSAGSERAPVRESKDGLRPAWSLISTLRVLVALSGVLACAVLPARAQAPTESAAPPPSGPPKLSAADLEKLLMPIALYPDGLIATMLPAAVYPLEIVQAARFVADPKNVPKIDEQSWDANVKAVAKIPDALKKMNDDLPWTIQLGEVFLNQDKDVMDMIQSLRNKAQKAGTLKTTEQQIIIVTNTVVEKTVEQRVVVVTNTVVQIVPSNPQVIYVPTYPVTVYAPPPGPPPFWTFAAGVAVGAIIANNCDWHGGGVYWGGGGNNNNDVNIKVDNSVNIGNNNQGGNNINRGNTAAQRPAGSQKWQPDQGRVKSSGSPTSAKTMESRGYGSGSASAGARPSTQPSTGNRGGGTTASTRPSTPSAGTRPSTPSAATRPATTPSARPSGGSPTAGNTGAGARPSASPSASRSSAFGGGGGGNSQASQRGAASRSGGGGASRGGGGGSRGGGR